MLRVVLDQCVCVVDGVQDSVSAVKRGQWAARIIGFCEAVQGGSAADQVFACEMAALVVVGQNSQSLYGSQLT